MAAKSKNRLLKIENKLLKLDKLELKDVLCPICQSILIEPVTLPCFHDFCQHCFSGSVEYNALCCPLCRLRIGSWLRTARKQKNLVNVELWNFIQSKFSEEITKKTNGEDIDLPEGTLLPRLSEQGEIRSEYEAELKKLKAERIELEQKHMQETENLIKKLSEEEEESQRKYLETLKHDEMLAKEIQNEEQKLQKPATPQPSTPAAQRQNKKSTPRPRLKAMKIDKYLKIKPKVKNSPILPEDNTSSESFVSKATTVSTTTPNSSGSPEMVPRYVRQNLLEKKMKLASNLWNKENGDREKEKQDEDVSGTHKQDQAKGKKKNAGQSLLVSLPLPSIPGISQQKPTTAPDRNVDSISVDSMEELCFFKPIKRTPVTKVNGGKGTPLRIPPVHGETQVSSPSPGPPPTRAQYLESLCQLRSFSLTNNLPSAFVITLNLLQIEKDDGDKCETNSKSKIKKDSNKNKSAKNVDGITKLNNETNLRRTKSVGNIAKYENETTPKKAKVKQRKVSSERKPRVKSNSKKINVDNEHSSPLLMSESINNNRVNLAVKNLSSPLENCDVKEILQEQIRVQNLLEQEKSDFELARKIEAEWNSRRLPRRAAIKRQVSINYSLRPTKKLKV